MQTYLEPSLSHQQGRQLWLAMGDEVKAQQLLVPSLLRTVTKLAWLLPLFAAALSVSWLATSWLALGIAYGVLALLLAQFAFVGHDAGHRSISHRAGVNRAFGQLSMSLVTGLAFDEWITRHHTHHKFCQDETRDPDLAVAVVASLTAASSYGKTAVGRFMTRTQDLHIWLLSFFFGHSQRHLSQAGVLQNLRTYRLDAGMLAAHFALWFALPCLVFGVPFTTALLTYLVPLTLLGPYLAAIFWVNHIGMPLVREVERFSFFEHQLMTSRTIVNPPAWDWLFGGLNFQIEHHLFPQVPSVRLGAVQTIVQTHCSRHRIAYQGLTWWQAVASIAAHLRHIARNA
jgi:fatty acid desaturase